jgi:integrase
MTTKVGVYKEKRNKNKPWVVRWFSEYDPAKGKQRHYSKSFARKRDAESFAAAKQAELDQGQPRDRPQEITLGEFTRRFKESHLRNRRSATRYHYSLTLQQLNEFIGEHTLLRDIGPELADRFVSTRQRVAKIGKGYSPWSRNRQLGNAKTVFNAAVRWGYLTKNPFEHIMREKCSPRTWHHLKPEEFRQLLSVVSDLRWRAFYFLAYTTGARFGEMFNLLWTNIDYDSAAVRIHSRSPSKKIPPFSVKDHESRRLLLPAKAVVASTEWEEEVADNVPFVLLTPERWKRVRKKWELCRTGRPWIRDTKNGGLKTGEWENRFMVNNVIRDMRTHVRAAGLELTAPLTVHTLRKSFGQNHADNGTAIHVLQGLIGHADISTTREFYLQKADANEREAMSRYESLL